MSAVFDWPGWKKNQTSTKMKPELTDSRRLTGANLFWDSPSAIIDVAMAGALKPFITAWEEAAQNLLEAVGYAQESTCYRVYDGGASLLISAPIDVLYSMCELNEAAWAIACRAEAYSSDHQIEDEIKRLNTLFSEESFPRLLALQEAAVQKNVPFLWDDDEVSIGYGKRAMVWPRNELPSPEALDWSGFGAVPLALVTGTNGKSTTVRMTAAIMQAAGLQAGLTSTDFIRVGERTIDTGDYSGTGGARMLMRQSDLDIAVLEVARGGLLRRGLGVEQAHAALITNVASDHLGEYGINSVDELRLAKFIVHRALKGDAPLILNADDEGIVAHSNALSNTLFWISLDSDNPVIRSQLAVGGRAAFLRDGWLVLAESGSNGVTERAIVEVNTIPAARGGVVRYNISNALGALAIATILGLSDEAIRDGLAAFRGDENDNPGRGNWFENNGVRVLVDFAHNPHGLSALADVVRRMDAKRVMLTVGQAGDRLNQDIEDLTRAACSMNPDRLLICDLPGYERGREPFEVAELIRGFAQDAGIEHDAMQFFPSPRDATQWALEQAHPGDLVVLLALTQRTEALELIHEHMGDDG